MVNNTVREIRRHAKNAGLENSGMITTHCFRKSCGQNWANHLPLNVVKELMGHANVATTDAFYLTVTEEHLAKAQWITEKITVGSESVHTPDVVGTDAGMTQNPRFDRKKRVG